MNTYINIGNASFTKARNDEYVDKSMLIAYTNSVLNTERQFMCVTRARRFGKSMAAKMLNAYYDEGCDSRHLFQDLKIAQDPTFNQHLNKYPVIYVDITNFTTASTEINTIVERIESALCAELCKTYPELHKNEEDDLMNLLLQTVSTRQKKFIMIIDEWDAICREANKYPEVMKRYVNFLRHLFKESNTDTVFAGVYMTGILPIYQYDTQSALNNFREFSMLDPKGLAGYFGFVPSEVEMLAEKYQMDIDQLRQWYDGYQMGQMQSVYNPYSVIQAVIDHQLKSYWTTTGAYESLRWC